MYARVTQDRPPNNRKSRPQAASIGAIAVVALAYMVRLLAPPVRVALATPLQAHAERRQEAIEHMAGGGGLMAEAD